MASMFMTRLAVAALTLSLVHAQTTIPDYWNGYGTNSFYFHNRYHGLLAMSAYGDFATECPKVFTNETLQRQYPGNTNPPFQILGTWGPTPKYRSTGYIVKVPEMNKILAVYKGDYGWQNWDARLRPFPEAQCKAGANCLVHTGAYEAWKEVQVATNDFAAIKQNQGSLVWSSAGHGSGGMIAQVAALDLKARGLLFSTSTFGSPAVFNQATADKWNSLFAGDASQRTVANGDSVPQMIPLANDTNPNDGYQFVDTGIHLFGTNPAYGQDFYVCQSTPGGNRVRECWGGDNEADHYLYYTPIGTCGTPGDASYFTYNQAAESTALASESARYYATSGKTLPTSIVTAVDPLRTYGTTTFTPTPGGAGAAAAAGQTGKPGVNAACEMLRRSISVVLMALAAAMAILAV